MNDENRKIAEGYLIRSGWKKDACGWWTAPFGYGLDEAVDLHKEAYEKEARAFNEMQRTDPEIFRRWITEENAKVVGVVRTRSGEIRATYVPMNEENSWLVVEKIAHDMVYRCGHPRGGCPSHCDPLVKVIETARDRLKANSKLIRVMAPLVEVGTPVKFVDQMTAALRCIVDRFEREDKGGFSVAGGTAWAMYTDAKAALEGRFLPEVKKP